MRLILTRHGKTIENEKGILQGQLPGKLSKEGIIQAKKLAERLKDEKIDAIYSSDLARAADTTKIIAKKHPGTKIVYTAEFREFDFGSISGEKRHLIDWTRLPNDVETVSSVRKRAKKFLEKLHSKHKEETVVLVGHGGINRVLISLILHKPASYMNKIQGQRNTAVNVFEIREDKHHKIHLLNCTKHLDKKKPGHENKENVEDI